MSKYNLGGAGSKMFDDGTFVLHALRLVDESGEYAVFDTDESTKIPADNGIMSNEALFCSKNSVALGESTQAGRKSFKILGLDNDTKTILSLDSVDGITVNTQFTIAINQRYEALTGGYPTQTVTVTAVNATNNSITLKNAVDTEYLESYASLTAYSLIPEDYTQNIGTTSDIITNAFASGYGCKALGYASFATGYNATASGYSAHAEGGFFESDQGPIASGDCSHAEGGVTTASGNFSHAEGCHTTASGNSSHAEGYGSSASGEYAHAEGQTTAVGYAAHAEGLATAVGYAAHAEGGSKAVGNTSHAEGESTHAAGTNTHAEGASTRAGFSGCLIVSRSSTNKQYKLTSTAGLAVGDRVSIAYKDSSGVFSYNKNVCKITAVDYSTGTITVDKFYTYNETHGYLYVLNKPSYGDTGIGGDCSHAEGSNTVATGTTAHAEGKSTTASGNFSHSEGENTQAEGEDAHAEGYNTSATSSRSHAEGEATSASGYASHAEGSETIASGDYGAHAEGYSTTASGVSSHAEGNYTTASGMNAHAEGGGDPETGTLNSANGPMSHVEGCANIASGNFAHAEGRYTIASGEASHVEGKYNVEDTENKYAHIVGNGTGSWDGEGNYITTRSNAHTLDWNGNAWFAGTVTCTNTIIKSSTEGSTKLFKITVDDSGTLSAVEYTA